MILLKIFIFVGGILVGYALRRESDRLRGWDEGFQFGRRHGRALALKEDAERRAGGMVD